MNLETLAYMHVKSSDQGTFADDASRAGTDRSICLAVRFRGEVPHDVKKGSSYAVTQHEPVTVVREWSASTVQFLTAMWNNQTLDEVGFDFVRTNKDGKEEIYATLTLTSARVAFVELRSGNTAGLLESSPRSVDYIGLQAQVITFVVKGPNGDATASYQRTPNAS